MDQERRDAIDSITNPLVQSINREGILNKQLTNNSIDNNKDKQKTNYIDDWSWCIYCNFDCCFCFLS